MRESQPALMDALSECRFAVERYARRIRHSGSGRRMAAQILKSPVPKLQIGCGKNLHTGWLNADISASENSFYLDATRPLPFPDASFAYVFSEHMIEHIPVRKGIKLLEEIFRVLRPNGRVRIATPDLKFLIDLYDEPKTGLQRRYIEFAAKNFLPGLPPTAVYVINNTVRDWGHQFIYDRATLRGILKSVGFVDVVDCKVMVSQYPELCGLESHGHTVIGEEFNELETMVIEGRKP